MKGSQQGNNMIQKGKISNGVKAIVLRAAGINCDMETEYALELAGAEAERVHINRIIEDKELLEEFQILVFPGGGYTLCHKPKSVYSLSVADKSICRSLTPRAKLLSKTKTL